MVNKYRKGYLAERKVAKFLQEKGFYVIRSAGSKGLFDIIAIKKTEKGTIILGIQVKANYNLVHKEVAYTLRPFKLREAYDKYGIIPLYATTDDGIKFYETNGLEIKLWNRKSNTNHSSNNSE